MPPLTKLDAYDAKSGHLNVVVETPQGSRNKYEYDPKLRVFKISCLLPACAVFPFDFGFIPSTLGDDGDPLDVLVLNGGARTGRMPGSRATYRRH
jgi:inorganic pyrophosphatase